MNLEAMRCYCAVIEEVIFRAAGRSAPPVSTRYQSTG